MVYIVQLWKTDEQSGVKKITWQVYNHIILVNEEQGRVFLATERLFLSVWVLT